MDELRLTTEKHAPCRKCDCRSISHTQERKTFLGEWVPTGSYYWAGKTDLHCTCDCHIAYERIVLGVEAALYE